MGVCFSSTWDDKERRLTKAIGLASLFIVVEVVGGVWADSLAILSDAAHLASDVAGFGIALVATLSAKSPGSGKFTYGFARADVFGAILSIISLWVVTIYLVIEAIYRAQAWIEGHAAPVNGKIMFFIAIFGVCVNLVLATVFGEESGEAFHLHDHSHDHAHGGGSEGGHGACSGHGHTHKHSYQALDGDDEEDEESHGGHRHEHGSSCGGHDHSHEHEEHSDHEEHAEHDHSHSHEHSHSGSCSHSASSSVSASVGGADHDHGHGHVEIEISPLRSNTLKAGASSSYGATSSSSSSSCGGDHGDHDHSHEHDSHVEHEDHSHSHSHDTKSDKKKKKADKKAKKANDKPKDANIEAAYLHVLTDLAQSAGVAVAGAFIWWQPTWQIIDPACTFVFSALVCASTIPLMRRLLGILLEGTPAHVEWSDVEEKLRSIEGVVEVHDLHVWNLSSQTVALTVHMRAHNPQRVLTLAHQVCKTYDIEHATIQVADAAGPPGCPSVSCSSGKGSHALCVDHAVHSTSGKGSNSGKA